MAEEIKRVLAEVQLENFYVKIRDVLQVTRIDHFDSVKANDLLKIGMSKPAIRRLKKALNERKSSARPALNKFLPLEAGKGSREKVQKPSLACLISESDLQFEEKLGDGSFGVVKKALWKKTGEYVAVKVLKRDIITSDQILEDFIREVNVMHSLNHQHLVKLHGVCLGPQHMMVTELAPLGALLDYLHKNYSKTLISTLHLYSRQLAEAMAYLESKSFIHRDIALRNIFLLNQEHIKLGDFGLARVLNPDNNVYIMAPDRKIPFAWCAPESLKRREFTHAADAWMYAVTLWELYTFGQEPWMGFNGAQILYKIDTLSERLNRPEYCPTEIYQMMLQCWLPDPEERPTFKAIVNYLAENHPVEMKVKCPFSDSEKNKLNLLRDDLVLVIDGRTDKRWWYGQNKRTLCFGYFPRPVLDPLRPLSCLDISKPLPNTFVHLGSSDGVDNPAISLSDQVYSDIPIKPKLIKEDTLAGNFTPTYLPCRKAINTKFSSYNLAKEEPITTQSISQQNTLNPFSVDVFMPELFAAPSSAPVVSRERQNYRASVPSRPPPAPPIGNRTEGSQLSLIDKSSAHYAYLPKPLEPHSGQRNSSDATLINSNQSDTQHGDPFFVGNDVRSLVAGLPNSSSDPSLSDNRSRRSAPCDDSDFFPSQQQQQLKSQAGDLATQFFVTPSDSSPVQPPNMQQPQFYYHPQQTPAGLQFQGSASFASMHSHLANMFNANNNNNKSIQNTSLSNNQSPLPIHRSEVGSSASLASHQPQPAPTQSLSNGMFRMSNKTSCNFLF